LAIAAGLVFGVIAALRATRADLHSVMKADGRSVAGGSRGTLRGLAAAEAALAVLLLTAAGMMADTFQRLQARDLGFEPSGVLTFQANMESARYATAGARLDFIDRLLARTRAMPGVESASLSTVNPLCCGDWGMRVSIEGQEVMSPDAVTAVQHQLVTPGFFETMRIRLLRGRSFTADDQEGREPVVIVDERAARRFWPGEDPVGKRVKRGSLETPGPWITVVGVVAAIEDEGEYGESWYLPYLQHPTGPSSTSLHFMVRAADPLTLAGAIRTAAAEIDPTLPLHEITTLDAVRSARLQQNRLGAVVTSVFAVAGLLLAALGLYGVLSFVLASDTREIGVRLALGAPRRAVAGLVFSRAAGVVGAGLAIGAIAAVAGAGALERIVPGAQFSGAMVVSATAALSAAALIATIVPAIRAMRVDPLVALRQD
jgi:predicted permease